MVKIARLLRVRFSLRTLIIATALFALAFSWAGYQLRWIQQRREITRDARCEFCEHEIGPLRDGYTFPQPMNAPWPFHMLREPGYSIIWLHLGDYELEYHGPSVDQGLRLKADDPRLASKERRELERIVRLFPEAGVWAAVP